MELQSNLRTNTLLCEYLEKQSVGDAAVDDMDLGTTRIEGFEAGFGLGQHTAGDGAGIDQHLHVLLVQRRDQFLVPVQNA